MRPQINENKSRLSIVLFEHIITSSTIRYPLIWFEFEIKRKFIPFLLARHTPFLFNYVCHNFNNKEERYSRVPRLSDTRY